MSLFDMGTLERLKVAQAVGRSRLEALALTVKRSSKRKSPVRRGGTRR